LFGLYLDNVWAWIALAIGVGVFLLYLYVNPRFWYRRVVYLILTLWASAIAIPSFFTEAQLNDIGFFRVFVEGVGWTGHLSFGIVFIATLIVCLIYELKKDTGPSKSESSPPTQPIIENQTNIAGNQNNAGRDLTRVGGDLIHGDKVGGDWRDHEAGHDIYHSEGGLHVHHHYGGPNSEQHTPSNLHQISDPVTDFVGREEEIKTLLAAFEGGGKPGAVISGVRGMGGVGKTELAKVLAKRLKARFPDGQISFNLRGASEDGSSKPATAAEALTHVIRTFLPEAPLPEEVDKLKGLCHSVLEGKQVLLLMDNALDAHQLAPLAAPPDGCGLMVTSRHRFVLPGMQGIDLDKMPPEEARELVLKICPRIDAQADALAKRCGHLPLALRLAASALEMHHPLQVEDYIKRLDNEEKRLVELDKDKKMVAVDLGITASLAASYNLLDERLQRYWRALSVFPGDFDAPAAASVWQLAEEDEAASALGDLYGASMVLWDEATKRFRLHDLARDYARARLSEEGPAGVAQRHAAHYAVVLLRTDDLYLEGGDAMLRGLALFDREWGNIRAGQAWVAAHWEADQTAARLCSDYSNAGVYCLNLRLHSRAWIAWLKAAVEAVRSLGDRMAEGSHLGNLGLAYAALGEARKAIEFYEQQLAIVREIGDRCGEGNALGNLGNAYGILGETRKAIEYHEQALVISRELKDRRAEGQDLGNLGIAYANLGETRKAIEYYQKRIAIAREIGDRRGEGNSLGNVGVAYASLGEMPEAIGFFEQALVIARKIGDRRGEGNSLGGLGVAYADLGETRKAIEFYEQDLAIAREIGDRRGEGNALGNLGNAFADLGETQNAIAHVEQALEILEQIESPHAAQASARLEELRK
jgi:tetratricopeptide (TPR) repeat protein